MSSNPKNTAESHGGDASTPPAEETQNGHSGEGAASAMAHMISRGAQQQRQQSGEADDAAGGHHER